MSLIQRVNTVLLTEGDASQEVISFPSVKLPYNLVALLTKKNNIVIYLRVVVSRCMCNNCSLHLSVSRLSINSLAI